MALSLDFELAWGSFDRARRGPLLASAEWTHDTGAPRLLQLLERYHLPATWATVGALMHDGLPPDLDERHAEAGAPPGWFSGVPRSCGETGAPQWFAPRFIDRLQACPTPQDIGFHGWSHVPLGPEASSQLVAWELQMCRKTAASKGLAGLSFVYPRNRAGHLGLLASHGFRVYRSVDPLPLGLASRLARPGTGARSAALMAADALALAPPLVEPVSEQGIVAVPGSLMVRYAGGLRGALPDACRRRRLSLGLRNLVERGGTLHVWLHPINLWARHPRLLHVLEAFFARVAQLRDSGDLEVRSLADIEREWRGRQLATGRADPTGSHAARQP